MVQGSGHITSLNGSGRSGLTVWYLQGTCFLRATQIGTGSSVVDVAAAGRGTEGVVAAEPPGLGSGTGGGFGAGGGGGVGSAREGCFGAGAGCGFGSGWDVGLA